MVRPAGYPKGIEQKILAGTLDETQHRGSRTRLLRFAPGVFTTAPPGYLRNISCRRWPSGSLK
jgi:hypothetical protein